MSSKAAEKFEKGDTDRSKCGGFAVVQQVVFLQTM